MTSENTVLVYRFACLAGARQISPHHMWGTLEAIGGLPGCMPLFETGRKVHAKLLEDGFYFEHTATNYVPIEEPFPKGQEHRRALQAD